MATMKCPASGCRNGYIYNFVGGLMTTRVCIVCKGTGRVGRKEPVQPVKAGACPYNACGGVCKGKGYYDYKGFTIYCNVGKPTR